MTATPYVPRTPPSLSVVLPAFNEARNLAAVLAEITSTLRTLTDRWEVIVVDDGSRDATPEVILPWLLEPGVRYVRLSRNFGKEAALTAGIERARGDAVVLMDADGQHPVELIAQMFDAWREGVQMVSATRQSRNDETFTKRLGTRFFYAVVNAGSRVHIAKDDGDFRLMDRQVVDALKALPERNRFMKGLYAWVGFKTRIIPYLPEPRRSGRSTYSTRRLAALAFTGITAFSNLPLRIAGGVGALIALLALAFGGWVVVEHFVEGHAVPGYATLVTSLMFFSGVQLLSVGILGEYIGRIFDEVKQRPVYLVDREAGTDAIGPRTSSTNAPPAQAPLTE
jgi:glycosyltransferase involved in cell wall biosynthesis